MIRLKIKILFWFIILSLTVTGEEITIYSYSSKTYKASAYAFGLSPNKDNEDAEFGVYKISKELGKIKTGDISFSKIFKIAQSKDNSSDPFFGPGFGCLIKDSAGIYYLACLEYEEGHKTFNGFRMGVGRANDLGSGNALFIGDSFESTVYDKNILKQLKIILIKKHAQAPTKRKH